MAKRIDTAINDSTFFTLFNEIGIISQLSNAMFERSLPDGLTNSQFAVLNWFFRVDSEASPGRLAAAFQVTGGAMTNTLKKLQAKGFVKIEPDASSGRKKRVTITRKGKTVRDRAIASAAPLLKEFAEVFSVTRLDKQVRELQRIRQYLDEYRYRQVGAH
ncbi:MAG: MarR family winged helix-turn-helix transcriptional regulator [Gammaproteobacteria bacterium]|jgi:DNA-binding MarR family transcriptional regulator|nr:MarR family winged helix-turn-helix transcriptional regulator [Gammaproteobacteria bacterium]MDP6535785.1 MarR family winged helix-turn-helix transcriptional regulator [Gammaproteobacteria bacterium]MDP6731323.1 MarR family winged helix-turn-helix transcriptional regulator [Gammaproteobacteria bacterium]HAJ76751.1 MarR family transcriptional regulator [Gammaproteobacteria bacterium]|tara:strand:+ start:2622 stop:3101 length:480 start_codon:yes stop_codon:yes gene_type:complete